MGAQGCAALAVLLRTCARWSVHSTVVVPSPAVTAARLSAPGPTGSIGPHVGRIAPVAALPESLSTRRAWSEAGPPAADPLGGPHIARPQTVTPARASRSGRPTFIRPR